MKLSISISDELLTLAKEVHGDDGGTSELFQWAIRKACEDCGFSICKNCGKRIVNDMGGWVHVGQGEGSSMVCMIGPPMAEPI